MRTTRLEFNRCWSLIAKAGGGLVRLYWREELTIWSRSPPFKPFFLFLPPHPLQSFFYFKTCVNPRVSDYLFARHFRVRYVRITTRNGAISLTFSMAVRESSKKFANCSKMCKKCQKTRKHPPPPKTPQNPQIREMPKNPKNTKNGLQIAPLARQKTFFFENQIAFYPMSRIDL